MPESLKDLIFSGFGLSDYKKVKKKESESRLIECGKKYEFSNFDQLYAFHRSHQDRKLIITPKKYGEGYEVEIVCI